MADSTDNIRHKPARESASMWVDATPRTTTVARLVAGVLSTQVFVFQ
jgi:hypothetical protein